MNLLQCIKSTLKLGNYVIKSIDLEKETYRKSDTLPVIHINLEPRKSAVYTCPVCGKRVPKYDTQYESRKWRVMDILGHVTYVHAPLPRLHCSQHGIITASVPWAVHNSKFSEDFEFYIAWLACYLTKTAAATLALVDWHTVGAILSRIRNRVEPNLKDRLNNLKIIGVDETSYKKGHKYITTVVNLETNEVVWISEGHGKSVFSAFFRELTEDQKKTITTVAGDGAQWIDECIAEFVPTATRCVDTFHVISWCTEALDDQRKEEISKANQEKEDTKSYNHLKYGLLKNPENLTINQIDRLTTIFEINENLETGYRLKEQLRAIFRETEPAMVSAAIDYWIDEASNSCLDRFIELAAKIERHKTNIINTVNLGITSAKVEANNNVIKVLIRKAYGFRNLANLFDLIYITCSCYRLELPCRGQGRLSLKY